MSVILELISPSNRTTVKLSL